MEKLKVLALIFLVSAFSFSQSINVTFQVDMSVQMFEGNFPPGANVVVRGDFQTDSGDPNGNWQGNLFQLSDADDDSIYTGTFPIPSSFSGTTYNYKYVITTPEQPDDWENILERQFTLNPPSVINPVVYFNNDTIPIIIDEVTNTINFTADISSILGVGMGGAFDPYLDSLLVMGLDWDNYGKNVVGNRRMVNTNPFNPGIYTTSLTVTSGSAAPNGIGDSTKWKFKANPGSRFQGDGWEYNQDRWFVFDSSNSSVILPLIVPDIRPLLPILQDDVNLIITVDMSFAHNRYNGMPIPLDELEFVGIRGTEDFLGIIDGGCWCPDDTLSGHMKVFTHLTGNLWRFQTIIPAGTVSGVAEFRFGAMYPGADTINGGFSPLDNEVPPLLNHVLVIFPSQTTINSWNNFGYFDSVEKLDDLIPTSFKLEQNYPNPFNPSTKIRYSILEYSSVTLKVFNLLAEEIETLVNSEQSAGVYEATFDASNLSSGIYFYTLKTENFSSTKKMILIK